MSPQVWCWKVFKALYPRLWLVRGLNLYSRAWETLDIRDCKATFYFKLAATNLLFRGSVYKFSFQGDSNFFTNLIRDTCFNIQLMLPYSAYYVYLILHANFHINTSTSCCSHCISLRFRSVHGVHPNPLILQQIYFITSLHVSNYSGLCQTLP